MRRRNSPRWLTCPNGHQYYARTAGPHARHQCAQCGELFACECIPPTGQAQAASAPAQAAQLAEAKPAKMWWEP